MNFVPNHPLHPDVCKCSSLVGFGETAPMSWAAAISANIREIDAHAHPLQPTPRTCRYCQTMQRTGINCSHCGAPDDGKRGPLEMGPMRTITA
jgi:hypothetical protein